MKKAAIKQSYLALSIIILIMIGLGCANVPSTAPDLPNLIAEFRFVNAAADVGALAMMVGETEEEDGTVTFIADKDLGTVDYGTYTDYSTYPSGNKAIIVSTTSDTLRSAMGSYRYGTVIVLPKTGAVRGILRLLERKTFELAAVDTGMVRFVNVCMLEDDVTLTITSATDTLGTTIAYGEAYAHTQMPPGLYKVDALVDGYPRATTNISVSNKKWTTLLMGTDEKNLRFVNLMEN